MKRIIILDIISVLFVTLFLYTGISKLIDYSLFKEQISMFPFLKPIANYLATFLPIIEFIVAIAYLVPRCRMKALYGSLILMIVFTVYIILILSFSENIPCSCGGIISKLSWTEHFFFNSILIVFALVGINLERRQINRKIFGLNSN